MALNLSHLDGTNGFRIDGADAYDYSGYSVSGAGDVNGDGIDDLVIGAPAGYETGAVYVVFGRAAGFPARLDLAALDGSDGFRIGTDDLGSSVADAGDINGDGIADLIVGGGDRSYVVFGNAASFDASFDLASLDGTNGFQLQGSGGRAVAGAGDVNGDGINDLIVGNPAGPGDAAPDYAGEAYVVFGTRSGFDASLDVATLNGTNGFRLDGTDRDDHTGISVSGAGDVNGDGIDDLIVGADYAGDYADHRGGRTYVVFGTTGDRPASLSLSSLDGTNGFRLDGAYGEYTGWSVAGAGDVNGDGIDDLIIGSGEFRSGRGDSFVVFGSGDGFSASLDLSDLDGTNGFHLVGSRSGFEVDGAGDLNGDGFDDLIIGTHYYHSYFNRQYADRSYVVFGSSDGFDASIDLLTLAPADGFRLDGAFPDRSGFSVAAAGDVNGDGLDDLIVGAPHAEVDGRLRAGVSHVVFGSTQLGGDNDGPSAADDTLDLRSRDEIDLAADHGAGADHDPDFDDLTIASIEGTAVVAGQELVLASGLRLTFVGGTVVRFDLPGAALGTRLSGSFSYEVTDGRGGRDTASATLDFIQIAIALAELDGRNGFRFDTGDPYSYGAYSVAGAGDVNGDGIDDVIVGSPDRGDYGDDRYNAGASFVVFGSTAGFPSPLDLLSLDGSDGFRLDGINPWDRTGASVAGAGDVNGDGIDDLIIGARSFRHYYADDSYVVFGTQGGFDPSLDLSDLDGSNGFRLTGVSVAFFEDGSAGTVVAGAGDFNGDGLDDLILGARDVSESYVIFGSPTGFAASVDVSELDGTNGFRLFETETLNYSGTLVAGAGDVNGDGIDDLIIGAPGDAYYGDFSYVVFGSSAAFTASLDLRTLDGTNGFRLDGINPSDGSGSSVAGAGDVNGDGFDDLIIGAPVDVAYGESRMFRAGASYVLFGSDSGFAATIDLATLDGSNGFSLRAGAPDDEVGSSVAGAGDFNGDGIGDLIVGAPGMFPDQYGNGAGASFVVFGTTEGFGASIDLASLDSPDGFRLDGIAGSRSGASVAGAGDINGDGFDDVIIGGSDGHVVFGFATEEPRTHIFGGPGRDRLAGSKADDAFHPGGGFDFVRTGGGSDAVFFDDRAGERDVLTVTDFDADTDTLELRGATVAKTIESAVATVLQLDGPDRDIVVLLGLSESPLDLI